METKDKKLLIIISGVFLTVIVFILFMVFQASDKMISNNEKYKWENIQLGDIKCSSDADCGAGQSCFNGKCNRSWHCVSNSDCGTNGKWIKGDCVDGGQSYLSPDSNNTECSSDADCGTNMACVGSRCFFKTKECYSDNDCYPGVSCIDNKCSSSNTTNNNDFTDNNTNNNSTADNQNSNSSNSVTDKNNGEPCSIDSECVSQYCNPNQKICEDKVINNNSNIIDNNIKEEEVVEEKCYIKIGNNTNNLYCYGTDLTCSGFSQILEGVDKNKCSEVDACYEMPNGKYAMGKYSNQTNYKYYGTSCPACYKNAKGEYYWTNSPSNNDEILNDIAFKNDCVTPFDYMKLVYIGLIVILVIAIIAIIMSIIKNRRNYSDTY